MRTRFALLLCAFAAFGGHAFAHMSTGIAPVPQSPIGTNLNESTPITFSWSPSPTSGVTGYDVFATTGTRERDAHLLRLRRERQLVHRSRRRSLLGPVQLGRQR